MKRSDMLECQRDDRQPSGFFAGLFQLANIFWEFGDVALFAAGRASRSVL